MQISLRGCEGLGCLGDAILPIGMDSMGNPIYPSGTTAAQLEAAAQQYGPTGLPVLDTTVNVTPQNAGDTVITNPTSQPLTYGSTVIPPGGTVTIPAPVQTSTGMYIALAAIVALFIFSRR